MDNREIDELIRVQGVVNGKFKNFGIIDFALSEHKKANRLLNESGKLLKVEKSETDPKIFRFTVEVSE